MVADLTGFYAMWARILAKVLYSPRRVEDEGLTLREYLGLQYSFDGSLLSKEALEEIGRLSRAAIRGGKEDTNRPGVDYKRLVTEAPSGGNPLQEVVRRLRANPDTKKATMCIPHGETTFPCLTTVDFKLRDGRLHTSAFFRSQDVLRRFPANVQQLMELSHIVATELEQQVGTVSALVASAHLYEMDAPEASGLLRRAAVVERGHSDSIRTVAVVGRERLYRTNPDHVGPLDLAFDIGLALGSRGWQVLTGGLGGIMESAAAGVRTAGGHATGIIPHLTEEDRKTRYINGYQPLAIHTGLEQRARIPLIIDSTDLTIAINGGGGTRVEIERTLAQSKPVIVLAGSGGASDEYAAAGRQGIFSARSAAEVMEICDRLRPGDPVRVGA